MCHCLFVGANQQLPEITADWQSEVIRGPLPKPDTLTLYVQEARPEETARHCFDTAFVYEVGAWPMGCVCDFQFGIFEESDEGEIAGRRLVATLKRYLADALSVAGELTLLVRHADDLSEEPLTEMQAITLAAFESDFVDLAAWDTKSLFVLSAEPRLIQASRVDPRRS